MMVVVDGWSWRAEFARRRLAARYAEEGREHPGFCAALVVARGERGLTIEEMAAELGCGPATLEALEAGLISPERAPASVRELLAASLGVPAEVAVEAAETAAAFPATAEWGLDEGAPGREGMLRFSLQFSQLPDELAARRRLRSERRSAQLRAPKRASREPPSQLSSPTTLELVRRTPKRASREPPSGGAAPSEEAPSES